MTTAARVLKREHLAPKVIASQIGCSLSFVYRVLNSDRYVKTIIEGEINGEIVVQDMITFGELKMKLVHYRTYLKSMSFGRPWAIFVTRFGKYRPVNNQERDGIDRKIKEVFSKLGY